MSTVAEIESAIERLSANDVEKLGGWFDDYRATVLASAEVFRMLDAEEGEGEQWRDPR